MIVFIFSIHTCIRVQYHTHIRVFIYLYTSHIWYDCIITRIIVSISKYKYSYNCMYSCLIIVCLQNINDSEKH